MADKYKHTYMELLVYKASAGSGKTFTLAVEYIKLLILNPRAYRQILAVTFTNKATAEMKERILTQLYGIWKEDPASDAYLKRIKEDLAKKPETASLSDRSCANAPEWHCSICCTTTAASAWKQSTRFSSRSCATLPANWNSAPT